MRFAISGLLLSGTAKTFAPWPALPKFTSGASRTWKTRSLGSRRTGMKTLVAALCLLACAFLSDAQITTTLRTSPDGSNEIVVKNTGAVSLAAFGIVAHRKADDEVSRALPAHSLDPPSRFYFDSAMDPAVGSLLPNEERTVARSSV